MFAELKPVFEQYIPEGLALHPDLWLIGEERAFDSMTLVELCLTLEDRAGEEGFVFDWTSEHALSRSRSIFRTLGTLAKEYERQKVATLKGHTS